MRAISESGWRVEIHNDPIEVTSNTPYADPRWRFTDPAGHEHFWDYGYPTLIWIVDEPSGLTWEDGFLEEYPEVGHYECPKCGLKITPGTKIDTFRRFIPGTTYANAIDPEGRAHSLSKEDLATVQRQGLEALPALISSRLEE